MKVKGKGLTNGWSLLGMIALLGVSILVTVNAVQSMRTQGGLVSTTTGGDSTTEVGSPGGYPSFIATQVGGCKGESTLLPRGQMEMPNRVVESGLCQTRIHSEPFWVYFYLPLNTDPEAVRAALQLSGAAQPDVILPDPREDRPLLLLHYPAGEPGERLTIRLAGPIGPNGEQVELAYDLERVATPRVLLEYRQGDGPWQAVESGSTLPRGAVELRFRPPAGMSPESLAERMGQQGYTALDWGDSEGARLRLATPSAHLLFDLNGLPAAHDLYTDHSLLELFTGDPPALVALDPATGKEEQIGQVPVNVHQTLLSPDGQWIALVATDPAVRSQNELWVMESQTGKLHRTGIRYHYWGVTPYWRLGELVVPVQNQVHRWSVAGQTAVQESRGSAFTAISPDGRYLAGITYDMRREDEHFLAPASIVLHDLETGEDRLLVTDEVKVRIPHSEIPAWLQMAFSPDGAALLVREPLPDFGAGFRTLRLDLASGRLDEVPDWVEVAAEPWMHGPLDYAYLKRGEYGEIRLRGPAGQEQLYGTGHLVGWLNDGPLLLIRWENAAAMRWPEGV